MRVDGSRKPFGIKSLRLRNRFLTRLGISLVAAGAEAAVQNSPLNGAGSLLELAAVISTPSGSELMADACNDRGHGRGEPCLPPEG
jgi:hypothetical protein